MIPGSPGFPPIRTCLRPPCLCRSTAMHESLRRGRSMRRSLLALFIALMVFSPVHLLAKTRHRKRSDQDPATMMKARPEAEAEHLSKEKRSVSATAEDETPAKKHPGPVVVGPPSEIHITKASGKKFDLRTLPFRPI